MTASLVGSLISTHTTGATHDTHAHIVNERAEYLVYLVCVCVRVCVCLCVCVAKFHIVQKSTVLGLRVSVLFPHILEISNSKIDRPGAQEFGTHQGYFLEMF